MAQQRTAAPPGEERKQPGTPQRGQRSFRLRQTHIHNYLSGMREEGRAERTIQKYRTDIGRFCAYLGEEQLVYPDTVEQWKAWLIQAGYAPRSVNCSLIAINGLLGSIGRRDWQHPKLLELPEEEMRLLSREEYYLLLEKAKEHRNLQAYLLIKTMVCTGLTPSDFPLLTREAVQTGLVTEKRRGVEFTVPLPEILREDLLRYADHKNISSGPLFMGSTDKPLERSVISKLVASLGLEVGLPPGTANPRNLHRLYQRTMEELQKQAESWLMNSYNTLLEEEDGQAGWELLNHLK